MRHSPSKLPIICAKSLWEASSAQEWGKILLNASQIANNTQHIATSARSNPPVSLLNNPNGRNQDPFSIYCELEVIAASISEARELPSWPSASSQLAATLLQLYDERLRFIENTASSALCLEILWHSIFISLYADLNLLEICAGRDGHKKSQQHMGYTKSWAISKDGQRCALHGALILQKSGHVPVGATTAIHLPRVLFNTAIIWYWYAEFGHESIEIYDHLDEFTELKMLGINCKNLLFEAHGFKVARPTKLESSTLYELVDLLRRQGSWPISRKLASLINLVVHGDIESET